MKILKFGGTSVGSVEALKALMGVIKQNIDDKKQMIIVVSAMVISWMVMVHYIMMERVLTWLRQKI